MTLRNELDEILSTGLSDALKLRLVKVLLEDDYTSSFVPAPVQDETKYGWIPVKALRTLQDQMRSLEPDNRLWFVSLDSKIYESAELLPHKPKGD